MRIALEYFVVRFSPFFFQTRRRCWSAGGGSGLRRERNGTERNGRARGPQDAQVGPPRQLHCCGWGRAGEFVFPPAAVAGSEISFFLFIQILKEET